MAIWKNGKALATAVTCCLIASCGIGKDKYSDLTCDRLKDVELQEQSRSSVAARAFERDPTSANQEAMNEATTNSLYAADVRRDKKCPE